MCRAVLLSTVFFLALAPGCGGDRPFVSDVAAQTERLQWGDADAAEVALILRAANELDYATLDEDVGLDSRAAAGIVAARPFAALEQLDGVRYVGPGAFERLYRFAIGHWPASVHGIDEGSSAAAAVLDLANHTELWVLDGEIGLDSRAARNIVDHRPLSSLAALDAVPYVGETAFSALAAFAGVATECRADTLWIDGASFSSLDEAVSLAPAGATIELCPGTHVLGNPWLVLTRDVSLRGGGSTPDDVVVRVDHLDLLLARVTLDHLTLTGTKILVHAEGSLEVRDAVIELSGELLVLDDREVSFVRSMVRGLHGIQAFSGHLSLLDTVIDGLAAPIWLRGGSSMEMSGGALIRAEAGGVDLEYGSVSFGEVDLGSGAMDNHLWDVRTELGIEHAWDEPSTTIVCGELGCVAPE